MKLRCECVLQHQPFDKPPRCQVVAWIEASEAERTRVMQHLDIWKAGPRPEHVTFTDLPSLLREPVPKSFPHVREANAYVEMLTAGCQDFGAYLTEVEAFSGPREFPL